MKKILISIMLMASFAASAQTIDHFSNVQFNLGGGVHTLLYTPVDGSSSIGLGGLVELQYQHMFNHNIGVGVGVQAATLKSSALYNYGYKTEGLTHPDNGLTYDRSTSFNDWREVQNMIALGIPVQLMLRAPITEKWAFQGGLGVQIDIPMKGTYKATDGEYTTTGYFPSTNVTYSDLPNHGFETAKADKEGDIKFVTNIDVLADLGAVYNINETTGLYLGLYCAYGLNSSIEASDAPLLDITDYSGTMASNRIDGTVNPLMVGLKLGLRMGMGKNVDWKKIKAAEEAAAKAEQERLEAEAAAKAEQERLAAEKAKAEAEARAKAEAEARAAEARAKAEAEAKAAADSVARAHAAEMAAAKAAADAQAAELARLKAEADSLARAKADAEARAKAEADSLARAKADAEARAKAEAEARAKAEAEARARAKAEQKAREEAAFLAGYKDVAYFETGKDMPIWAELNEDSWDNLKDVMDRYPDVMVTVTGHTDNVGQPAKNMKLSQSRADNIKAMLVKKGIAADRIQAVGKGDTNPIESNKTKEGRAKNRRIEITIYRQQ